VPGEYFGLRKIDEIFVISVYLYQGSNFFKVVLLLLEDVTNFIQSYLYQFFDDSHGLKASLKPLRRTSDQCQSRLEEINNGQDIKQVNW